VRTNQRADTYAFLFDQLGMQFPASTTASVQNHKLLPVPQRTRADFEVGGT
jgi:hypothetical protein